jgi:hypothetical protein
VSPGHRASEVSREWLVRAWWGVVEAQETELASARRKVSARIMAAIVPAE